MTAVLSVASRCMHRSMLLPAASLAHAQMNWAPCTWTWWPAQTPTNCSTSAFRCYSSEIAPGTTTTTTSSSSSSDTSSAKQQSLSAQHAIQQQHQQQHKLHQEQQHSKQPEASTSVFSTDPDAFTRSLQSKTEQEVFSLLNKARAAKLAEAAAAANAAAGSTANTTTAAADATGREDEDDTVDVINPETGEAYGPRGKEPTRYGDWEVKGRCTDFA